MATRRGMLRAGASAAAVGLALAAWVVWSWHGEEPPSTAEDVAAAVMSADPATLPEAEREQWAERVGGVVSRLPPHEFEKVLQQGIANEAWRQRFDALGPQQRRKMAQLISQEQRLEMMLAMVATLKALPAPLRKTVLRQGRERGHPDISKELIIEHIAATTPSQRARFMRAMRELRAMLVEAGVEP